VGLVFAAVLVVLAIIGAALSFGTFHGIRVVAMMLVRIFRRAQGTRASPNGIGRCGSA
jgi:hypothetical protein